MNAVVQFQAPRLPYHDAIAERFGVDKGQWKVLAEAIFPAAKSPDSIVMALSYCKARNLDVFKRPVHIVPMYDKASNSYIDTVWPGIAELRTTAFRTGQYAGCDAVEFGPDIGMEFTGEKDVWENRRKVGTREVTVSVTFPEWGVMTVWRMVGGVRVPFVGPKVYWLETYGKQGKLDVPNEMWAKRPRGQLEKCVEAAALRKAFPEEIGNDLTAEEMAGQVILDHEGAEPARLSPPSASAPKAPAAPIHVPLAGRARRTEPEIPDHMQGSAGEDLHRIEDAEEPADAQEADPAPEDSETQNASPEPPPAPETASDMGPDESVAWRKDAVEFFAGAKTVKAIETYWRNTVEPKKDDVFPGDWGDVERAREAALKRLAGE